MRNFNLDKSKIQKEQCVTYDREIFISNFVCDL
jgi:hypothetical protein